MKQEIIEAMEKYAIRIMEKSSEASIQEVATLPDILKILQKETANDDSLQN